MKIGAVVFAGFILAVGLVYASMGMNMPRGSLAYPGPGLFPTLIGVFLVAAALGCLLQEIFGARRAADESPAAPGETAVQPAPRNVAKTVQLMALLAGYALVLKPAGFPLAIFVFAAVAIRIFGYRRWLPTVAIAAVIATLSYAIFVVWLKVALPLGVLEPVLGG